MTRFEKKVWLSSPTMHGEEIKYVTEAYETNWMSTVGANINEVERLAAEKVGCKYAVALSAGTAALHLCTKLAGEALYGMPKVGTGALQGHKVFCSDMTFDATVNPIAYENGEAVFIDTEYDTWNMDPVALEKAFEIYPEVRLVVLVHLYGTPGKVDEIRAICKKHNALLIEDAAESFGATYKGVQTGKFGDYSAISFNGNKIITGSSGGMFLTDSKDDAEKVRKWSTQSRGRLVPARRSGLQLPHEQRDCRRGPRPDALFGRTHRPEKGNLHALQGWPEGSPRGHEPLRRRQQRTELLAQLPDYR